MKKLIKLLSIIFCFTFLCVNVLYAGGFVMETPASIEQPTFEPISNLKTPPPPEQPTVESIYTNYSNDNPSSKVLIEGIQGISNNNILYIGSNDKYLKAIDLNTNEKLWSSELNSLKASAIGSDGTIYAVESVSREPYASTLYAINPSDGTLKWSYSLSSDNIFAASMAIGDGDCIYLILIIII